MDKKIRSKIIKSPLLWIGVLLFTLINIISFQKEQQVEKEALRKIDLMVENVSKNNIHTFRNIITGYINKLDEIKQLSDYSNTSITQIIDNIASKDSMYRHVKVVDKIDKTTVDSTYIAPILNDTLQSLHIEKPFTSGELIGKTLSFKIPLRELHAKIAESESFSYSYLTLTHNDVYVYHPDESKIGLSIDPMLDMDDAKEKTVSKSFSDYLNIPVYTYYEKLEIDGGVWTITANVPDISFNELVISVRTAFIYMAISASLAFGLIMFLGIMLWQREYMKRQKAEQEKIKLELKNELQKQQVLATELEQLKSGLNPHFLFNSLSSLKILVDRNPDEAKSFAVALSNLYRYILKQQNFDLTTLEEELKFSKDYIYLQQIRFRERIKVTIDIDKSLLKKELPTMSLQLLIENSIKHTKATESNPLIIDIYTESDYLVIKNNYNPPQQVQSSGIGLENLTRRYKHITTRHCYFSIQNNHFVAKTPLL